MIKQSGNRTDAGRRVIGTPTTLAAFRRALRQIDDMNEQKETKETKRRWRRMRAGTGEPKQLRRATRQAFERRSVSIPLPLRFLRYLLFPIRELRPGLTRLLVPMLIMTRTASLASEPATTTWHYELLPDSYLVDDCPPCGRPTIMEPLRGSFELRFLEENPLFSQYALEQIQFQAGSGAGRSYKVSGGGSYSIGGEVALVQDITLDLHIHNGVTNPRCILTNSTPLVRRYWPIIEATLVQTNGTFTQVYHLHLFAAPVRELWFSTVSGMTPGIWNPPTNRLSDGDLLSQAGHVVKSGRELTQALGLTSPAEPPGPGLDAVDVLPGGEMAFSSREDLNSRTLGPLGNGDLISNRGRLIRRNQDLTAAFHQMPPAPDAGLNAVQVTETGEVYFSIEHEFFSESLGQTVGRGDLLSSSGIVVKSNEQLLARFQPADPHSDHGLDAIHVWPSGEVWFSVETSFQDLSGQYWGHGDLLSDQGYVVVRNRDLVGPFQPLEDLADFGLDALFIVSDATAGAPPPRFTRISRPTNAAPTSLEWEGKGRVFQVLRAQSLPGTYVPVSPILPDLQFDDGNSTSDAAFYRLQQW